LRTQTAEKKIFENQNMPKKIFMSSKIPPQKKIEMENFATKFFRVPKTLLGKNLVAKNLLPKTPCGQKPAKNLA
jgi:hypothetical protein